MKKLFLGDEAIAQGAIDAGLSGVYAYPGTPSTEITEDSQANALAKERGLHSRWCTNEKTTREAALGMSFMGKRAMVCMKHVGLNVCADPFVNSAMTGVGGGVVVVVADDPSMHSSQDEQDSRFYGKFAMLPVFEPSNQQEAYDMMADAFDYSERQQLPVLMRVTTRQVQLEADAVSSTYNKLILPASGSGCPLGIIASGIAYNYVMETLAKRSFKQEVSILKVSQYPLPKTLVRQMLDVCDKVLVVEEGQPFVEEQVRGVFESRNILGRLTGELPRTGELTPDCVAAALNEQLASDNGQESEKLHAPFVDASSLVAPRPPQLCQGCGHRDVYTALNEVLKEYENPRVFGDIGCYTLGFLPPYKAIHSCVDMGASITMAKGAADAGQWPALAIIGDSTFTHSGMTGLLDAVNENADITVIISDNLTTAMTGGQDSAGTNKFEAICRGLGVADEHLHVVVPLPKNMPEITRIIREEINYHGVSVIIPQRECIQTFKRHAKEKKVANK